MMKRTGVFCYYSPRSKMEMDVLDLLVDLKKNLENLIIVVNGNLTDYECLESVTDFIFFRGNAGYDAGAFKMILGCKDCWDIISDSDELVLCNSSFYGPFIPFGNIFEYMENSKADFWGLASSERVLTKHIQSYFLVFRRRILISGDLLSYFEKFIDEFEKDYYSVCCYFECGLFQYLIEKGYIHDAYVRNISCDNYKNPYGSVAIDKLPILKKKIFSPDYFGINNAIDALAYVERNYKYNLQNIIDDIIERYGITINKDEMMNKKLEEPEGNDLVLNPAIDYEQIKLFIEQIDNIYIYGAGGYGRHIFLMLLPENKRKKLKGFLVSDKYEKTDTCLGYPIFKISDITNEDNIGILMAMSKEHVKEVKENLRKYKTVLSIWRD